MSRSFGKGPLTEEQDSERHDRIRDIRVPPASASVPRTIDASPGRVR